MSRENAIAGPSNLSGSGEKSDLWSDILKSADRKKVYGRKNIIVLSERHHGRRHLIDQLISSSNKVSKRRKRPQGKNVAMGYEILQMREEGDEESVPPLSIFYPPTSHEEVTRLIPSALPPSSKADTAVMIILDWTKPREMITELMRWLKWIDQWVGEDDEDSEREEMRDRLQSIIQHYNEPPLSSPSSITLAPTSYSSASLLPLGPGTLSLNSHGVPIIVVCTKADLMDNIAEPMGLKTNVWEERCDWIQQVLRTICLAYGAALFYTSPTRPSAYTVLRSYLLHRLYTSPAFLSKEGNAQPAISSKFPFAERANVLDRDAVMVPLGWDSWGKIKVLRDRFEPDLVERTLKESLVEQDGQNGGGLQSMWEEMIPEIPKHKPSSSHGLTTHVEPEQSFLSRTYENLQKDPNRDPRAAFRQPSGSHSASQSNTGEGGGGVSSESKFGGYGGVVGPMGSGGLSLPGVEKVMNDMEGGVEDLKEKFAKLGRKDTRNTGPLSPTSPGVPSSAPAVPNEALHNFFQGLLATKGKSSSSGKGDDKKSSSSQASADK